MSNNVFEKFANEIKFNITPGFSKVKVEKAQLVDNVFELDFSNNEVIPFNEMEAFLTCLNTNFKYKARFNFEVLQPFYELPIVKQYVSWLIGPFLKKPNLEIIYKNLKQEIDASGKLTVTVDSTYLMHQFQAIASDIERIMKRFGFSDFSLNLVLEESEDLLEKERIRIQEEAKKAAAKMSETTSVEPTKEFNKKPLGNVLIKIAELKESGQNKVTIEGEIFNVAEVTTKTGMVIFTYSVTDYKDAIYVKTFARNEKEATEARAFIPKTYVTVSGDYQLDSFTKEPTIIARKIKAIENQITGRVDEAPIKRVELNARTRMSTMDGIVSATELVERAKRWGHKAIAIVDTDSVQSFPDFYNATKKDKDFKAIYGVTLNAISKNANAIINPINKSIEEESYVVFDLETTGLSPIFEDIIEFGAVKVIGGQIVDKKQFFVKPTKPIPAESTEITGITNDMVKDAKPESEAMADIRSYLDGFTLVAHNASFDITFVNEKLSKYGLKKLTVPVIDSMIIARMTQPDAKRYRLENVAGKYGVNYDALTAHRADYDADVLARVWIKMIDDLKSLGISTQTELFNFTSDSLYSKAFSNEVTLIAENQEGLKELFKITSKALTDNLFGEATVFFEDLANRKNILLGSGALKSHLVDTMLTGSKEQIIEEISRYDYIEVQPLQNFAHIINRGFKQEQIEESIRFIIEEAKKQGKLVVATGDVRYLDLSQKIYHEVYIYSKGLGGARHYLFRFNESNPVYPDQHFLTTDEMVKAFAFLGDVKLINEIVISNTNAIADMVERIEVIKDKLYAPIFGDSDNQLEKKVYENAYLKYGNPLPKVVEDRIKKEIEPIKKYGFSVIYWIAHLLVDKSLRDGYLVGSRGSVGSSFVATMANITEVNPLDPHYLCKECKHSEFFLGSPLNSGYDLDDKLCPNCNIQLSKEGQKIPFETFLGFNADKVPDIDLNFSGEYQPTIHNEVKVLFGESHSFRAGTISTVAEKTAFGYVKAYAEETNKELSKAFIEYLAKGVAGTKRTSGQHPGGIIVIPKEYDVEDFTPINYPANDINSAWKTTHFDFHAIHDNVLKLDLLGHDDPTAIKYLESLTGVNAKKDIPFSDEKIISLFSSTEALGIKPEDIDGEPTGAMGIPEFGTTFVRKMLKTAKVTSFGDLISISGLSHGTDVWTGNAEKFVKEMGKKLNEVISCRDNIMTDLMEKGIEPIKSFEIMERVRKGKSITQEQEDLLKKNGVEDWYIESLKLIKYMFPKAHATAYVMMAWRIAYFKLYHPEAYYATYFTTRADVFDIDSVIKGKAASLEKLKNLKARKNMRGEMALTNKEEDLIPIIELAVEAYARGVKFSNISLEKSDARGWKIDPVTNELIPPFVAIDGLGEAVADSIIIARNEKPFVSLEDLQKRTSINKTNMEKLRELGVLKGLSSSSQMNLMDMLF